MLPGPTRNCCTLAVLFFINIYFLPFFSETAVISRRPTFYFIILLTEYFVYIMVFTERVPGPKRGRK
jgi:hypothetical protein